MKKFVNLLIYLLPCSAIAQSYTYKAVQILPQQEFYLNGGVRSALGGKSRTAIAVNLPPNTERWYYAFVVSRQDNSLGSTLDLLGQLSSVNAGALAAKFIMTPTGSGVCDVYVTDLVNSQYFISKSDESWRHYSMGARENARNGYANITSPVSGTYYLNVRNPSQTEGISVKIEAVAIVRENTYNNQSEITYKNQLDAAALKFQSDMEAAAAKFKTDAVNNDKATTYYNMGMQYLESGDIENTLLFCKKALELNPDMGDLHAVIGLMQLQKGQLIESSENYAAAAAWFNKKVIGDKYYDEAIADIKKAQQNKGAFPGSQETINLLRQQQNFFLEKNPERQAVR